MNEFRSSRFALAPILAAALALLGCAADRSNTAPQAISAVSPLPATAATALERLPPVEADRNSPALPSQVRPVSYDSEVQLAPPQPPPDVPEAHTQPGPRPPELLPPGAGVAPPPIAPVLGAPPSLPLDLPTALGLTQGQNPRVAFAQAQISQAYAQYQAARVLWLPSIRAGMNYNKHEGRIQNVEGRNIETTRGAAYGGLGASAVGAGSPAVPGLQMRFHLADAVYQPRIASANLSARQALGAATLNDQLLATALAYLELLEALQRKAIADETLKHGEELAELTAEFARTGAGNQADADRAAAALAIFRNEAVRAEEEIEIASARVAQQLSADPSILIVPQEPGLVPIDLMPPGLAIPDLVATGLSNRPELSASRSLVDEAVLRMQRERHAPWLPSMLLGASYGEFGAARGSETWRPGDRFDLDAAAWWEVRNLGFGDRAARNQAQSQIQQARMREVETMDLVAREIVEAAVEAEDRRPITIAQEGITRAQQSYDRNLARIRNAQGLPIEVLQSIQALDAVRREYLRSVMEYNRAQFRLQRALGWPVAPPGP
jgi:outer membrane protein TolC